MGRGRTSGGGESTDQDPEMKGVDSWTARRKQGSSRRRSDFAVWGAGEEDEEEGCERDRSWIDGTAKGLVTGRFAGEGAAGNGDGCSREGNAAGEMQGAGSAERNVEGMHGDGDGRWSCREIREEDDRRKVERVQWRWRRC